MIIFINLSETETQNGKLIKAILGFDLIKNYILENEYFKYITIYIGTKFEDNSQNHENASDRSILYDNTYIIENILEFSGLIDDETIIIVYIGSGISAFKSRGCKGEKPKVFTLVRSLLDIVNIVNFIDKNEEHFETNFESNIDSENSHVDTKKSNYEEKVYFFRGHADARYEILPPIFREGNIHFEKKLYDEFLLRKNESFWTRSSVIENLTLLQHYGIPIRLLDITSNILIAFYFACESQFDKVGEVIIFEEFENKIKYIDSKSVGIASMLSQIHKKSFTANPIGKTEIDVEAK